MYTTQLMCREAAAACPRSGEFRRIAAKVGAHEETCDDWKTNNTASSGGKPGPAGA